MVVVLAVHGGTAQVGHELSLVLGPLRDFDLEFVSSTASRRAVNAVKEGANDAESLGDDATDLTGVVSRFAKLDLELNDVDATEGARAPELVVIEGARVHAEAVVGGANQLLGAFEETEQVGAARLLLGLEDKNASWQLDALLLQVPDGEHARERCIAVISTATAVKVLTADDGVAGAEALVPALHPWLLVKVTIKHDVLGAVLSGLNHIDDQGAAALRLENLSGKALNAELLNVVVNEFDSLLDEAVGEEVSIVVR
mmetsp:Transcript_42009/g.55346  ORF Transcript_42009/g.55346 Transcript_42009/m.55346 type:complete len:257 (-) Transcript_42009:152-922(-)